jgi:sulfur relay (sulfurtransferase) complex TusBCD TusD component (DsrE family)
MGTPRHQILASRLAMLRLPALASRLALASLLSTTVGLAMLGAPEPRFSSLLMPAASAGQLDPLFINLTSDEPHRLRMALSFARQQQALGHPVTIFLNDRGVLVGSKTRSASLTEQQRLIAELLASGGTVLICPLCMKHYGVSEAELLNGLQIGNPTKTGAALFRQGSRALSW